MSYVLSEVTGKCVWIQANYHHGDGASASGGLGGTTDETLSLFGVTNWRPQYEDGNAALMPNYFSGISSSSNISYNNSNINSSSDAAAAADFLTPRTTPTVPPSTTTYIDAYDLIVETARIKFLTFLESHDINANNLEWSFTTACNDFYRQCLFADAQVCIRDELTAWRTFCVYLPFAILLILIAFIFNGLSAYFVRRNKNKYPRHSLLQSLALSDTLLSLFTLIKRSIDFLPHSIGAAYTMPFLLANTIWQACWIVSACSVLLLSLDCFLATRLPFFYRNPKLRVGTNILMAVLWLFAVVLTVILAHFDLAYLADIQYIMCSLMVVILILVVVECIYVFLLAEGVRRQQRRYFYDDRIRIRQLQNNRKRSFATIAMVMSSTFICWLPLLIFFLLPETLHASNLELSNQFLAICLICFHINAIINPVLYSFRFKDVRRPMQRNFTNSKLFKPIGRLLQRSSVTSASGLRLSSTTSTAIQYLASTRYRHSDPNQHNTSRSHHMLHQLHRHVVHRSHDRNGSLVDDDDSSVVNMRGGAGEGTINSSRSSSLISNSLTAFLSCNNNGCYNMDSAAVRKFSSPAIMLYSISASNTSLAAINNNNNNNNNDDHETGNVIISNNNEDMPDKLPEDEAETSVSRQLVLLQPSSSSSNNNNNCSSTNSPNNDCNDCNDKPMKTWRQPDVASKDDDKDVSTNLLAPDDDDDADHVADGNNTHRTSCLL